MINFSNLSYSLLPNSYFLIKIDANPYFKNESYTKNMLYDCDFRS